MFHRLCMDKLTCKQLYIGFSMEVDMCSPLFCSILQETNVLLQDKTKMISRLEPQSCNIGSGKCTEVSFSFRQLLTQKKFKEFFPVSQSHNPSWFVISNMSNKVPLRFFAPKKRWAKASPRCFRAISLWSFPSFVRCQRYELGDAEATWASYRNLRSKGKKWELPKLAWDFICFFIILSWVCVILRKLQQTHGTYPRPSTTCLWRKSLHICFLGYLGSVPGVCWNFLRVILWVDDSYDSNNCYGGVICLASCQLSL